MMKKNTKNNQEDTEGKTSFFDQDDPIALFGQWLAKARGSEINDPDAMTLATVDENSLPDVRAVLLKSHDRHGFVFYSHTKSAKGQQLDHNPKAALNFHWKSLRRQVRVRGLVTPVSQADVDAYFASRPRQAQIGAWASRQSQTLESSEEFETAMAEIAAKFKDKPVPLPPGWGGWCVQPLHIEFWRDGPYRLHDRLLFSRASLSKQWQISRLYP